MIIPTIVIVNVIPAMCIKDQLFGILLNNERIMNNIKVNKTYEVAKPVFSPIFSNVLFFSKFIKQQD